GTRRSPGSPSALTCSALRSPRTCGWDVPTPPTSRCARRWVRRGCASSWTRFPAGSTRRSGIAAPASRPAGASRARRRGASCAVGLIATSAWLISRSSQRPEQAALAVAIVAVQAFALGRGLLRYCERLLAHDAALRALAQVRVGIYARLERLAPAGLPAFRSG